jgi:hypothetical protein
MLTFGNNSGSLPRCARARGEFIGHYVALKEWARERNASFGDHHRA